MGACGAPTPMQRSQPPWQYACMLATDSCSMHYVWQLTCLKASWPGLHFPPKMDDDELACLTKKLLVNLAGKPVIYE